ncbi:hypothetical protein [Phaffia rhodozyma]|uniref:Uncharacterized protein n=1 Tax=Phaffia rhodozyma TaxID=264483 RepID=A0A0F7SJF4_PHARH|nr:hypothetical protein [Phaffia rhodozyma]
MLTAKLGLVYGSIVAEAFLRHQYPNGQSLIQRSQECSKKYRALLAPKVLCEGERSTSHVLSDALTSTIPQ